MLNEKGQNIILALLIYLPSCAYISINFYLVLMSMAIYLNRHFITDFIKGLFSFKINDKNFAFLLAFALFAFILRIIDYPYWESIRDIYSFGYLFPFTYLVAKSIKGREAILNYIIIFILIEAVVALLQYICGVSTFYTGLENYRKFESYDLLYFTRVFGLSANSSSLALKFIIGIILTRIQDFTPQKKVSLEIVFILASVLSFGRIALLGIGFFYAIKFISDITLKRNRKLINFIPLLLLVLLFSSNPTWTVKQFTRNQTAVTEGRIPLHVSQKSTSGLTKKIGIDEIDMSGRNEIWNAFFEFWKKSIHFGNYGKKYLINEYHAHNSFLELLCSYGVYALIFFIGLIALNIKKNNYLFVGSIMFLAVGQYIIFWGISLFDILFYYLLFHYSQRYEGE